MAGSSSSPRFGLGRAAVVVLVGLLLAGSAAQAQENKFEISKYGGRVGFSSNPDQFTIGAYAQLGEIAPHLSMRPSVDLGWGDHVFTILGNADLQYSFIVGSSVAPFAGAGLGIIHSSFDLPPGVVGDDTSTHVGINVYGGVEMDLGNYRSGYLEARLGIDELPDFKLTAGLGFY
ncbi:MAG: hypothetical protein U0167_06755 [bacterium]